MLHRKIWIAISAGYLTFAGLIPAQAAPAWIVDPANSRIEFSGTHAGRTFKGVFETWTANIAFDPADPAKSDVTVTVKTASAKTGDLMYDGTLPQAEWLDPKTFPEAVFKTTLIKQKAPGEFEAESDLTLKGHKIALVLPFALKINGDQAQMTGSVKLDRAKFDIGQKSDAKAEWVSNDIAVNLTLRAQKKP
jgi:cytochrome b561